MKRDQAWHPLQRSDRHPSSPSDASLLQELGNKKQSSNPCCYLNREPGRNYSQPQGERSLGAREGPQPVPRRGRRRGRCGRARGGLRTRVIVKLPLKPNGVEEHEAEASVTGRGQAQGLLAGDSRRGFSGGGPSSFAAAGEVASPAHRPADAQLTGAPGRRGGDTGSERRHPRWISLKQTSAYEKRKGATC